MFKKVLLVTMFALTSVFSYSYTCFPPMTSENSLAINPVVFMDDNNSGGAETFFYYGITDKFDISSSISTYNETSNFSTMLRYNLNDYVFGIRANTSWAIPQISYVWEDELLMLQTFVASQITYDYSNKPAFFGVVSPGFKFLDIFDF